MPTRLAKVERRRILAVVDERPLLAKLAKTLGRAGYRVTGVPDGIAALKAAQADPPDLVILDLVISGVDGYGVCALLKRTRSFHAPVVVLSGRTAAKEVNLAFEAGADAVLTKPVDWAGLPAKVAELLPSRQSPELGGRR